MKQKAAICIFLTVLVAASALILTQWRASIREAELREQIRKQTCLFARLSEERIRLSKNLTDQIARKQNTELLRLRAEVSQLRKGAVDLNHLKQHIAALKEEDAREEKIQEASKPHPDKVKAYWPREQLAYVGHRDQLSALQTTLWAINSGDAAAIEATMTPEGAKKLSGDKDKPDPLLRQSNLIRLTESLRPATGFYLVSDNLVQRMTDFDQSCMLFKIHFDGEGGTRALGLKKVDDEWKFIGIFSVGGTDEKRTSESKLWP
jgi:hypothetical protein